MRPEFGVGTVKLIASAMISLFVFGVVTLAQSPPNQGNDGKKFSKEELLFEYNRRFRPNDNPVNSDADSGGRGGGSPAKDLTNDELLEQFRERLVYGSDNRMDWHEIKDKAKDPAAILKLARASVALFKSNDVKVDKSGIVKFDTDTLQDAYDLCPDQKFGAQPSGAQCSGTLVGSDLVLTAGHCVREITNTSSMPLLPSVRFVFGYRMEKPTTDSKEILATIRSLQIFTGKQPAVGGTFTRNAADWALVRLAKPVPPDIAEPMTDWDLTPVAKDQKVFVIGYPSGIPLKYAPDAVVRDSSNPHFFVANLDSFGGNSGSGVFDESTNKLVGILVRGEPDYQPKSSFPRRCRKPVICPEVSETQGCQGEHVTKLTEQMRAAR